MLALLAALALQADDPAPARAFLEEHCVRCHGAKRRKGDLSLHDLDFDVAGGPDAGRWEKVLEKIVLREMPPEDEDQPPAADRAAVRRWITGRLEAAGRTPEIQHKLRYPEYGNLVPHETLFDGSVRDLPFSPPRLWRTNPRIYDRFIDGLGRHLRAGATLSQPFTLDEPKGVVSDYAALPVADEATLQRLMMNCEAIARYQTVGLEKRVKDKKNPGQFIVQKLGKPGPEFAAIVGSDAPPTPEQARAAVTLQFRTVLQRDPDAEELKRYTGFLDAAVAKGGNTRGLQAVLTAILLRPEAIFRMEYGFGPEDEHGRRILSPHELAFAVAYALTETSPAQLRLGPVGRNTRPTGPTLLESAQQGTLATREDVRRTVRRMLDEDAIGKPRILRFFREFFGYDHAPTIFKGDRIGREFNTSKIVRDADTLVTHILGEDRDVLAKLLTTDRYFVAWPGSLKDYDRIVDRMAKTDGKNRKHATYTYITHQKEKGWNPIPEANPTWRKYVKFYNFAEMNWDFPVDQPFAMPEGQRAGMLTHPAWLIAWSGNFDNDVVRRGKWIREHLLAGTIPEVPITVNAAVPTDEHLTLRDRMEVTRDAYCWKCHHKMDPLGLPFESYDDFGRFRTRERTKDRKEHPVDPSGEIRASGDPELDGKVANAVELVNRLANSERVRQSFVRHAFRYWMGRNEKASDSRTLIEADRAYVESGGSFKALLVSLLSSDAFLYRKGLE